MSFKLTPKGILGFLVATIILSVVIPWSVWITGEMNAIKMREIVAKSYVNDKVKDLDDEFSDYKMDQLISQNKRDIILAEMAKDIKILIGKD